MAKNLWRKLELKLKGNPGIGTIEVILILVVLIALVLVFKSQIMGLVDTIFGHINSSIEEVY